MAYQLAQRMTEAQGSIIRDLLKMASDPGLISLAGAPRPSRLPGGPDRGDHRPGLPGPQHRPPGLRHLRRLPGPGHQPEGLPGPAGGL